MKRESKIYLTVLGIILIPYVVIVGLIGANRPESKPVSVDWIGHPMVSDNDRYTPSQGWIVGHKIGFRSDGVVVWTNLNSTNQTKP